MGAKRVEAVVRNDAGRMAYQGACSMQNLVRKAAEILSVELMSPRRMALIVLNTILRRMGALSKPMSARLSALDLGCEKSRGSLPIH